MRFPTYAQLPFLVRLALDPVRALDLLDRHTVPDHTKIVPFMVLCGVFTCQLLHAPLSVAQMLVVTSASFGASMYRMFLRSKLVTATATESVSHAYSESTATVTQILERRDGVEGVDPTHG